MITQCEDSNNTYFHTITTACCIWRASAKHLERTELKLFLLPYKRSVCVANTTGSHQYTVAQYLCLEEGRGYQLSVPYCMQKQSQCSHWSAHTHTHTHQPFLLFFSRVSGDGQAAALFWVWNVLSIPHCSSLLCEISKLVSITQLLLHSANTVYVFFFFSYFFPRYFKGTLNCTRRFAIISSHPLLHDLLGLTL